MKKTALYFLCLAFFISTASHAADTNPPPHLTVELRDGSRVVGNSVDDSVSVHSAAIGNLKLTWATIRAIEFAASTDTARLTATNGDGFTVQLDANTLGLKTDFGKTELPVKSIRSIKVAPATKRTIASATPAVNAADIRLTIELRDGSHLIGKGLDDTLNFHSATMGDLKLTWAGIRSVIYTSEKSPAARLTTTNGDAYEVEFETTAVRVETSFGKVELPVARIKNLRVSALGRAGRPMNGLLGWWSADGNAVDSVGGNNGILRRVSFTGGVAGQAFSFDNFAYSGIYTGIEIADQPAYALTNALTISGWIRPRGDGVIFFRGDHRPGLDPYALAMGANNTLHFNICDAGGNSAYVETTVNYFVWTHVAASLDGEAGTLNIYTNGLLAAQTTTSIRPFGALLADQSPGIGIGNVNDGGNNFPFIGDIDEVGLYDRALSADEINALYNENAANADGRAAPFPGRTRPSRNRIPSIISD